MRRYSPKPPPREFTTKSAGQYLTRKSRGAKFIGRDIVYTPEFTKYVSKHRTQKELRNALTARAEYVYAKGKPHAPTHMSRLAKIEYKQALKEYAIRKAELSQAINDETSSNMRIARRLSSYENARAALRQSASYWNDLAIGRIIGIMGHMDESHYVEMKYSDVNSLVSSIEKMTSRYSLFYKSFEKLVSANYGSDSVYRGMIEAGTSVRNLLKENEVTKELMADAENILAILEKYELIESDLNK